MKGALLHVKNATLTFDVGEQKVEAIKEASLTVPSQEITIIYGPSGSGKSSLLNMLSGLQPPTKGKLFYNERDMYAQTSNELAHFRAHELGIVYQTNYWVKSLNVIENISLPLYFLGYTKTYAHNLALEALDHVKMKEYAKKYPTLLSGGEQQRIAMARAIASNPPVIIADEPTGNLDSKNGDMIISLLKEFNKQQKKTIILVTHNLEYIAMASHLIEIQDGHVTEIDKNNIRKTVKHMLGDVRMRIETLLSEGGAAS